MNFTYEEALKEMDFLVEKMQLALPKESYRIQCVWEVIKASDKVVEEKALDDAWSAGYEEGKREGYDSGYDDGHNAGYDDGYSEGWRDGDTQGVEE